MKFINLTYVLFASFLLFACATSEKENAVGVAINVDEAHQTMEGFGASDAWRCQFVGKNWPLEKREQIAELLFSQETDAAGNPKGIGLSIWRFNIGAGSTEQGEDSGIKNEWRRGESFVNEKGIYDWNKQSGQQWFLTNAKDYGVEKYLAFSIAPPTFWSKNGKAFNSNLDGSINLQEDKFDDYSAFMVEVVHHFNEKGIPFDYLSPVNETQWDWEKATQEGTSATNKDIALLVHHMDSILQDKELKTKIVIPEAADLRFLYREEDKPGRANLIQELFSETGALGTSLSNNKSLKNTISAHSYFTTWPLDTLIQVRQELKESLENKNLDYWQSEFCILEQSPEIGSGHGRDLGMDTALYVARVIHADLTIVNASSWQWWTAISNADFKDGLIYIDTGDQNDLYNLDKLQKDGDFHDSKLLWAFGNFSRFIRPGMQRVEVDYLLEKSLKESYKDFVVSAFAKADQKTVSLVAINFSNEPKLLEVNEDIKLEASYITSEDYNLEYQQPNQHQNRIPARSIVTFTGTYQ